MAHWRLDRIDEPAVPTRDMSDKVSWTFSPAGRWVVSVTEPRSDVPVKPGQYTLRVHDTSRDWRVQACYSDAACGGRVVISADGRRLIVTDHHFSCSGWSGSRQSFKRIPFTLLSLPELDVLGRWEWLCPTELYLHDLALSPDGRTLALATRRRACSGGSVPIYSTPAPAGALAPTRTGDRSRTSFSCPTARRCAPSTARITPACGTPRRCVSAAGSTLAGDWTCCRPGQRMASICFVAIFVPAGTSPC